MKKAGIVVGKEYAVSVKSSAQARPVVVHVTVTAEPASGTRWTADVHPSTIMALNTLYSPQRASALIEKASKPASKDFIELWSTHLAAEKAAATERSQLREMEQQEREAKIVARQERVAALLTPFEGIEVPYSDFVDSNLTDQPPVKVSGWIKETFGGKTAPVGAGTIRLEFLEAVAKKIVHLQNELLVNGGGWAGAHDAKDAEIESLRVALAAQIEEAARERGMNQLMLNKEAE